MAEANRGRAEAGPDHLHTEVSLLKSTDTGDIRLKDFKVQT